MVGVGWWLVEYKVFIYVVVRVVVVVKIMFLNVVIFRYRFGVNVLFFDYIGIVVF